MEYIQGSQGRIFVARLDDGDDIFEELKKIVKKENIKAGFIHFLGASSGSKAVLGPEKRNYPPSPIWWEFDDVRELIGLGIVAWEGNEPKIHIHAGIGHSSEAKVGCVREKAKVYLTVEAVIQEIVAPELGRKFDDKYNASLLSFSAK